MKINVAWMLLTLGLGAAVVFGFTAFAKNHDLVTACGLGVIAICIGMVFQLCYHQTTGKGK